MYLSKSIRMFYKNILESSLDEDSDDDSELMMATTMLKDGNFKLSWLSHIRASYI
jgi:hypothetical protein